ncbi:FAD-dependent monooxygenase [Rhizobium sp. S152]|uniref:FAD binding domain-containing protein n=1 Tax=Rhizobium sp. S152 TaxID=3055038 RepID=UPI0025A9B7BF|nr:FAD-dependent monooxygenase [Rhizobium sp. S152]MDM9627518.1 FAD-dependent monooxygenase [Rhizobium sp. S152]
MRPLKIGVVGGSLAGLFSAILLQNDGHHVRVYERSAHGLAGRGAGLVGQGDLFRVLRAIGCEHVARVGVVARERIYFAANGEIAERLPTPQTQISWDYLFSTVASKLATDAYVIGRAIINVKQATTGAVVTFDTGAQEEFDLVIGADGISSVVRASVNAEPENQFAGYVAWRGLIPESDLPAEASILLDRFAFYVTKGIHALGYLVPGPKGEMNVGDRRYNWVWYRPVSPRYRAETFTGKSGKLYDYSLPRGDLLPMRRGALVEDAMVLLPKPFALAIEAEPAPFIQGIFDYQARNMVSQNIALVGDSAFIVRPHTAMGVAKAAGDAMALRAAISSHATLQNALREYEQLRLPVGNEIAAYGQALGARAL